eukprot:scaffold105880_cov54-Phaeocystis_antarctica.AAC.1
MSAVGRGSLSALACSPPRAASMVAISLPSGLRAAWSIARASASAEPIASSSAAAASYLPCLAARARGVLPLSLRAAASARASSSSATHAACPALAARCSGVRPLPSR